MNCNTTHYRANSSSVPGDPTGIARRAFERRFQLADHIKVVGASLDNGLLHVELVREIPEAMKPRTIAIQAGSSTAPKVEQKQAA